LWRGSSAPENRFFTFSGISEFGDIKNMSHEECRQRLIPWTTMEEISSSFGKKMAPVAEINKGRGLVTSGR
jgi:hypothetical protein